MIKPMSRFDKIRAEDEALTKQEKRIDALSVTTCMVLFIAAIPGSTGMFTGTAMGVAAIALGGTGLALHLAVGNKERKWTFWTGIWRTLTPALIGSLGIMGVLSGADVALGVTLVFLALFVFYQSLRCAKDLQTLKNVPKEPA